MSVSSTVARIDARCLELVVGQQHEPAEPGVRPGPLAEHRADDRHRRGHLRSPLKKYGSEDGSSAFQSMPQPRGAERAHQLDQLGVDADQPVERVDRYREEADQRDRSRASGRSRSRTRARTAAPAPRSGSPARPPAAGRRRRAAAGTRCIATAIAHADHQAIARPSRISTAVTQASSSSSEWSRRSACQVSTGEASVRSSTECSDATPCQASTSRRAGTRGAPAPHCERLQRALLERGELGLVIVARRGRGRIGTSSSATIRPGRGDMTATRSAR